MNVFYTVTGSYTAQLAASVCSFCENNRNAQKIRFFIGITDITENDMNRIAGLISRYGRDVSFIQLDSLRDYVRSDIDISVWNVIVMARLFTGELLPETLDRVIYLDADTIILDDLQKFWETDLQENVIGACIEPTVNQKRKKLLGLDGYPYYNAGVLLIDLRKWREQHISRQITEYFMRQSCSMFTIDQDAINVILKGMILTVSPAYNFSNIFWHYPYDALVRMQKTAAYMKREIFDEAANNPGIIHYLGEERPWRKGCRHRFSAEYHRYLAMTPWKDTALEEGWEMYFKFYYAFWKTLKPFPVLQYRIMDTLIPLSLRIRRDKKK